MALGTPVLPGENTWGTMKGGGEELAYLLAKAPSDQKETPSSKNAEPWAFAHNVFEPAPHCNIATTRSLYINSNAQGQGDSSAHESIGLACQRAQIQSLTPLYATEEQFSILSYKINKFFLNLI